MYSPSAYFNCISSLSPSEVAGPGAALPLETVRTEQERPVVMGVLETMNNLMKTCKEEVFRNPSRLKEISDVIRDVLKKKVRDERGSGDDVICQS